MIQVNSTTGALPVTEVRAPTAAPATGKTGPSFGDVLLSHLQHASQQNQASEAAVQQLIAGQSRNLHDVVLSVAQADLSIRLMLEIRNRLVESYQEIMRMQV